MKPDCEITMIKQGELSVTDRWLLFSVSERPEIFSFTERKKATKNCGFVVKALNSD